MKKTLTINLSGFIFHIDEDAYLKLESYLGALKQQFSQTTGGQEIVTDVEMRMAELFKERIGDSKEVINSGDVDAVIQILGRPEDYLQDDAESVEGQSYYDPKTSYRKKIHRDVDNRVIGGVSSGLAAYFNIDALWVRLLFVVLFFAWFGLLLYIILWIVVPAAKTTAEKLQMRGEPVTLSNIENFVKVEASGVQDSLHRVSGKASHYGAKGGNALGNLFSALFNLIKLILKFILKVIGFFLLFIGFITLTSLAAAFFVGIDINDSHLTFSQMNDLLQSLALDRSVYNGLTLGFSLLVLGPLFLLIYYGVRILFGVESLNSNVRRGLALVSLAGFILLVVSGISLGNQLRYDADRSEEMLVPSGGTLVITPTLDSISEEFNYYHDDLEWRYINGKNYFGHVKLDIRQSSEEYSYLETQYEAQGSSRRNAKQNTQALNHKVQLDANTLSIAPYFTLEENRSPYRFQRIDMVLYLLPGDTVYLAEGTEGLIYDIPNLNDYFDPDMAGHHWTMTKYGLKCADCKDEPRIIEPAEEMPEREDSEQEVIIEGDRIIIKEKMAALTYPFILGKAAQPLV